MWIGSIDGAQTIIVLLQLWIIIIIIALHYTYTKARQVGFLIGIVMDLFIINEINNNIQYLELWNDKSEFCLLNEEYLWVFFSIYGFIIHITLGPCYPYSVNIMFNTTRTDDFFFNLYLQSTEGI